MPVVSAGRAAGGDVAEERRQASQQIVRLLEQMPSWPGQHEPDAQRKAQRIEQIMRRIAAYDSDTIREGMAAFVEKHVRPSHWYQGTGEEKLFLLNKFLFELPETLPRNSPHIPYTTCGWWTNPESRTLHGPDTEDWPYVRWPWTAGPDGEYQLVLAGRIIIHFGLPYDGLRHFDYLRKHFSRRKISQPAQPSVDLPPPPEVPALKSGQME